jgi:hypothetical protein
MNQELFAEQMWKALLEELYEGKIVSIFNRFPIISIDVSLFEFL